MDFKKLTAEEKKIYHDIKSKKFEILGLNYERGRIYYKFYENIGDPEPKVWEVKEMVWVTNYLKSVEQTITKRKLHQRIKHGKH